MCSSSGLHFLLQMQTLPEEDREEFKERKWVRSPGSPSGFWIQMLLGAILGLYRDYMGIMGKKMETTIMGLFYLWLARNEGMDP